MSGSRLTLRFVIPADPGCAKRYPGESRDPFVHRRTLTMVPG